MAAVPRGGKLGHRDRPTEEDNVKRHGEKMAAYKPEGEAWSTAFPTAPGEASSTLFLTHWLSEQQAPQFDYLSSPQKWQSGPQQVQMIGDRSVTRMFRGQGRGRCDSVVSQGLRNVAPSVS